MYLSPKLIYVNSKQNFDQILLASRFNNRDNIVLNYRVDFKDNESFYLTRELYELIINKATKIDDSIIK